MKLSSFWESGTAPLMQTVPYGQVALEPHFLCAENHAEVGFKIGMDTKYVLKDVFEFARYVKSGDEHAYGKKLNFLHTPEAFDPLSQKIEEPAAGGSRCIYIIKDRLLHVLLLFIGKEHGGAVLTDTVIAVEGGAVTVTLRHVIEKGIVGKGYFIFLSAAALYGGFDGDFRTVPSFHP